MSETSAEDGRLDDVAETIRQGHESADKLAEQNVIDPNAVAPTEGEGDDVAPDDPS